MTPDDLNSALASGIPEMMQALTGMQPSSVQRRQIRYGSRGSLAIDIAGPKRGAWHDFEAGVGGDPVGLVAHLRRCTMKEAHAWGVAFVGGVAVPERHVQRHEQNAASDWSSRMARQLWQERLPVAGAALYLAARNLYLPAGAPIGFHPRAWRNSENGPAGPAMLALMTDALTVEPTGVHVTYLAPDLQAKAAGSSPKIMLGRVGVIRLIPDDEVTYGLGLAEGIETALAVMQRAGWSPVWAATSAGAIARFPILPGTDALTVFADADGPGLASARACCERWARAGREACILAPPSGDWDDALPSMQGAA